MYVYLTHEIFSKILRSYLIATAFGLLFTDYLPRRPAFGNGVVRVRYEIETWHCERTLCEQPDSPYQCSELICQPGWLTDSVLDSKFGGFLFECLARPTILNEIHRCFPQVLRTDTLIVSRSGHQCFLSNTFR